MASAVIAAVAVSVVSYVYMVEQAEDAQQEAERARREAEARADAAKGTQLVIDGEVTPLRTLYGRNLVGGARVYHNTFNNFVNAEIGATGTEFKASTNLDVGISGQKHEFLIVQQALCLSGINACYAVDVDDQKIDGEYVNTLNEVVSEPSLIFENGVDGTLKSGITFVSRFTHGCKTYFYPTGGTADPLMTANDITRSTALFTNTAFATSVYRLNRDDPQFNGVPTTQYYVEGEKIYDLVDNAGTIELSASKIYTANSALVLLDYLLNALYGRGLPIALIDLDSFYLAKKLCDKVMMVSQPLEGKFWNSKGGTRSVKLYECCIGLQSDKPIRENIEKILATMPESDLIWSGGKYKLKLPYSFVYNSATTYYKDEVVQYQTGSSIGLYKALSTTTGNSPPNTTYWTDAISAYITDSQIIREGETSITWPNAQTRFNYFTIRFLNEGKDFKEDTVSWPPKDSALYTTLLNEDHGILLESEEFLEGVSSYYNALAIAEQRVRKSRSSLIYSLDVIKDFIELEPGDLAKVTSEVLVIPGEICKVSEVIPDESGKLKLKLEKYDAYNFAWNVADDEIVPKRNLYSDVIPQVSNLSFVPDNSTLFVGDLTWTTPNDIRVKSYHIMYKTTGDWILIGRSISPFFKVPYIDAVSFTLAVVSVTSYQSLSLEAGWPQIAVTLTNTSVVSSQTLITSPSGLLYSFLPSIDPKQYEYEIREGGTSWDNAVYLGKTNATQFNISFRPLGSLTLRVKCTNLYGLESSEESFFTFALNALEPPSEFLIKDNILTWISPTLNQTNYPIAGYKLKVHENSNLNWNTALELNTGLITDSPFVSPLNIVGTKTIMIKAVDMAGNESVEQSYIITSLGDAQIANIVETYTYEPTFLGIYTNCSVVSNELVASELESFYNSDEQAFYMTDLESFYALSNYGEMTYISDTFMVSKALAGSYITLDFLYSGIDFKATLIKGKSLYGADGDSFYGDTGSFYEVSTERIPYLGPIVAENTSYEVEIVLGAGPTRGILSSLVVNIDAPDMFEYLDDVVISDAGTVPTYLKSFTKIKTIMTTLQANISGAVTVEVDKTNNLAPVIKAYNSAHTAVNGAKVDIQLKGY